MASANYGLFGASASTTELILVLGAGYLLLKHFEGKVGEAINLPFNAVKAGLDLAGDAGQAALNAQEANFRSIAPAPMSFYTPEMVEARIANPAGAYLGKVAASNDYLGGTLRAINALSPLTLPLAVGISNTFAPKPYINLSAPYTADYRASLLKGYL